MFRSMTLRTVFDLLVVGLLTLLVAAPSHARQAQNVPLEKIASQAVNCDLVMMVQTLELIQENPTTYDESASGKTYQYFDEESNLNYNYFRSYQPTQGRYTQSDPIGLGGGLNRFAYVGGNPLRYVDPLGLTQADIDNAFATAKAMMPNSNFPSNVRTWSQQGKAGKNSFFSKDINVDSKYLECLDDGEASALLTTILHEMAHFNQTWYQFGIDNVRERMTGGNSSRAQDSADTAVWNNSALVSQYLKNRHIGKDACQCRK